MHLAPRRSIHNCFRNPKLIFIKKGTYLLDSLICIFAFLFIQLPIAVFVEELCHNVVLAADIAITIQVITDVRYSFSSPLVSKFCASLLLVVGLTWAGPPIRNTDILSQDVASIVARLLLNLQIPSKHINSRHLMLSRIELTLNYSRFTYTWFHWRI
jgi:hypothetical protein